MTAATASFVAAGRRFELRLVRTDRGVNHLATPTRGGFRLACWHGYRSRPTLWVRSTIAEIRAAWRHELVCSDCSDLYALGGERFVRATGW